MKNHGYRYELRLNLGDSSSALPWAPALPLTFDEVDVEEILRANGYRNLRIKVHDGILQWICDDDRNESCNVGLVLKGIVKKRVLRMLTAEEKHP